MVDEFRVGTFIHTFAEEGKMKLTMLVGEDEPPFVLEGTYLANDGKIAVRLPSEEGGKIDTEKKGAYKVDGDTLSMTADGITTKLKKLKE